MGARCRAIRTPALAHLAVVGLVRKLDVDPAQRVGRHGEETGRERGTAMRRSSEQRVGRKPIDVEPMPLLLLLLLRSLL